MSACRSRSAVPCFALEKQGDFVRRTSVFESGTFLYPTLARGLMNKISHFSKKGSTKMSKGSHFLQVSRIWKDIFLFSVSYCEATGEFIPWQTHCGRLP